MGISPKQKEILEYILAFQAQRGFPPSLREIGREFGIRSTYGVRYHLGVLEQAGYLQREPGTFRGLKLGPSAAGERLASIPVAGRVAAGAPRAAVEEVEGYLTVDTEAFGCSRGDDLFGLRIVGESMKEAGILPGDIAVVRRQKTAERGEVVVAMVEEEATVKRFFPGEGKVELRPENAAYAPIVYRGAELEQFTLVGKVVGIIRTRL